MTQRKIKWAGARTHGTAGYSAACSTAYSTRVLIATAAAITLATTAGAQAGDVLRTATAGSLNVLTSWNTGTGPIPGSADVAVWDTGSAIAGALGGDLSFSGIRIGAGETTAVGISGANTLTLGADGIDMLSAGANLTIQTTPSVTTGIALGAAQTWNVGTGRTLTVANNAGAITGGSTALLTKAGPGTLFFNGSTVQNTFSGGLKISGGTVLVAVGTTASGGAVTSGPVGTGTITLNGGAIAPNAAAGKDLANDFAVTADSTIGVAGNARIRSAGTWDLGGVQRTITLANASASLSNSTEQFAMIIQGGKTFTLANGDLRFAAAPAATATNPSMIAFSSSNGAFFTNNSGITLGNNVMGVFFNSQVAAGTNAPKVTVESGGVLLLSNSTTTKNLIANALAGSGTISADQIDGTAAVATLTIDGATGSSNFGGTIENNYNVFGTTYAGASVNIAKTGGSTQTFSGTNTYTGTTSVTAGTLVVGAAQAIPQVSATTVGGGSGVATIQLGTTAQTTINSLTIASSGRVDLNKGQLLLSNGGGATALSNFAAQVATGRAGGSGVFSSASDGAHDIGFKDTGTGIYARYTLLGDADLTGRVDFNDFLVLQANFGQTGSFNTGDFNYDGLVNFNDFLALQANFGQSVTGAAVTVTAEQVAAMTKFAQSGPEPTSLAVLGLGAATALRRHRHRRV